MGFFLKFFALIMGMIMAFFFPTGTSKKPYEPETVDINGVVYKNCFIPEYATLITTNEDHSTREYFDYEEPFYIEKEKFGMGIFTAETEWYRISDEILLRGQDKISDLGSCGFLYFCKESEWDRMKSFYYNMDNWSFSARTKYEVNDGKAPDAIEINRELVNPILWNELMEFSFDTKYNKSELKNQGLSFQIPMEKYEDIKRSCYFKMASTDDLFCAYTGDIMDYDGTLYMVDVTVSGMYYDVYKLPGELQKYFRELDEKCDFSSFDWPTYKG